MTKKGRNIIIFLIILIIISLIIMINTILNIQNSVEKKVERLETSVNLDSDIFYLTDDNYPDNPYDLISLYLEGYALVYGSFMDNEEVVSIIIEQQRKMLSERILKSNTLSNQNKEIINSLNVLKENNFSITSIEIGELFNITEDGNQVAVKVVKTGSDGEIYNFKYYLEKDSDEKWKITMWENDNDKFNFEK